MLKKIGFAAGVLALLLLTAAFGLFAWFEFDEWSTHRRVAEREAYWTAVLDKEVRIGEPRAEVVAWARRRFPSKPSGDPVVDEGKAAVQIFPGDEVTQGLAGLCGDYVIILYVEFDRADRASARSVAAAPGPCI
jgi:hypothetical protein